MSGLCDFRVRCDPYTPAPRGDGVLTDSITMQMYVLFGSFLLVLRAMLTCRIWESLKLTTIQSY